MARDLIEPQLQPHSQPIFHQHRDISPDRLHHSDHEQEDNHDQYQGELLYRHFLAQRLEEEHLQYENIFNYQHYHQVRLSADSFDRNGYSERNRGRQPNIYSDVRDELSENMSRAADSFRRSGARQEVARRADMVDLDTLTPGNLSHMLAELFGDGGVTQERIMVLFYFCSDLAIRAVKSGLVGVVSSLTSWSVAFIRGVVATGVRLQGGWAQVMCSNGGTSASNVSSTVNQVAFLSACAAVMGVCAVYIKRHL